MIKGAIFDLDGTILDSMSVWDTVGEDYLKKMGKEPKENLKEAFKTFTLKQSACYFRENYGITLSDEEIIDGINEMVADYYINIAPLKPDFDGFLKKLKAYGVKMCIATVTDKNLAESALKRLGIRDFFSEIFTCNGTGHSKEEPHIYREALKHLKTAKNETVVFEDSLYALNTAKGDGFVTAGVFDIHEENQDKIKSIADAYIKSYADFDGFWKCLNTMKTALTIAGSDSIGGAGIQADIKAMTMNGVYAMSVITAMTAQNTTGVKAVQEATPEFLRQQIDAVFEDIRPDSVKIGMVSSAELIDIIAQRLTFYKAKNIVVDPVMVATSGFSLIKTEAIDALTSKLLPLAKLVTPNIPEAEVLSGIKICGREDMLKAARIIGEKYGCGVLIKGGHSINDANDILYADGEYRYFDGKRIDNPNTHGTGCTLSSAIAANLAKGYTLEQSIQRAKDYVSGAISEMLDLGKGSGPLNHAFNLNN